MSYDLSRLKNLSDEKLIDIVENFHQYGYSEEMKMEAMRLLGEHGIDQESLRLTGHLENQRFKEAERLAHRYDSITNLTYIFYLISLSFKIWWIFPITHFFWVPPVAWTLLVISLIMFIRSYLVINDFFKFVQREFSSMDQLIYFLIGFPFYFIMKFYFQRQVREELQSYV